MGKPKAKNFQKLISQKIRELRVQKGYSSYENFCWDNEFPTRTYFRMENGENFTVKNFLKVLELLEVSPEDFFRGIK